MRSSLVPLSIVALLVGAVSAHGAERGALTLRGRVPPTVAMKVSFGSAPTATLAAWAAPDFTPGRFGFSELLAVLMGASNAGPYQVSLLSERARLEPSASGADSSFGFVFGDTPLEFRDGAAMLYRGAGTRSPTESGGSLWVTGDLASLGQASVQDTITVVVRAR